VQPQSGRYALVAKLLSSDALRQYLRHREATYESLAQQVTILGVKQKPPVRCSKATIGHLCTGQIEGTSPERAKLIEQALEAPIGSLFVYKVARVAQGTSRRSAA
jgi:hypothetical protein